MTDLKILQNGEVVVAEDLKGTFADPTLPLPERMRLLAEELRMPLLFEAADHLASVRSSAERRGRASQATVALLKRAQGEIGFLRQFIREKTGSDPDYFEQMPVG
jgi:hypothetical protein